MLSTTMKCFTLVAVLLLAACAFAQHPVGTVAIMDGSSTICQATVQSDGSFSCANTQLSTLSVGTHSLTASYGGGSNGGITYQPSTSPVFSQVVQSSTQSTNTTLTCAPNPSVQGNQVTCSGTVVPQ